MRNGIVFLIVIMLSGCLQASVGQSMDCGGGERTDNQWWGDSFQWNSAPMSYGNTTNWTLNNTSDGMLHLNIDVVAYFSEAVGPLEYQCSSERNPMGESNFRKRRMECKHSC